MLILKQIVIINFVRIYNNYLWGWYLGLKFQNIVANYKILSEI